MKTEDNATTDQFRRLIDGPPILVFRPLPRMPLPPVAYILADVAEQPITAHFDEKHPLTRWAVTGDLVAAVTQAAVTGQVTYQEVQELTAGYTYEEVQVFLAATIYLDVQKNPRKVAGQ